MVDAPLTSPRVGERTAGPRPALGYALVLGAVALWSVNATVAKILIDSAGLSPLRLAELRATGSAVVLFTAIAVLRPGSLRLSLREGAFVAAFGIGGLAFVHFFYFAAITRLDIGIALVIQYLAPVLIALWARFFVHEPVRRRLWVALALSLTGLSLVVEIWTGGSLDGAGVGAALAAALAYAFYILTAEHRLQRGRDAYSLLGWGFLFAALFWALAQPWWTFPAEVIASDASLLGRLAGIDVPVWLLVSYVVVFGTVVPFLLMLSALRHIPATRATVIAMAEPVLAGFVAYAWLREDLGGDQIAGGVLVLVGILLAQTARSVRPT